MAKNRRRPPLPVPPDSAAPEPEDYSWDELQQIHEAIQERASRYVLNLASEKDFLERNVNLLASIFESVGDGLAVVNKESDVVLINHAAEAILGYKQGAMSHKEFGETLIWLMPDKKTAVPAQGRPVHSALQGKASKETFFMRNPHSQMERWIRINATPIWDTDGTIYGAVCVFQDITRATESAERINDLYHNAPCGYHSSDRDGILIEVNDTELAWLGYRREEIVGKHKFVDLLAPESVQTYSHNYKRLIKHGRVSEVALHMCRKNGTLIPVLWSSTALRDSANQFLKSRSVVFDVSERTRLTEQRDILAAIVTHDLKNHLIGESWILDHLLSGNYGDIADRQVQPLTMLKAGTENQLRMTSSLVEIYRYDVGSEALKLKTVDIAPFLQECMDEVVPALQAHDLSFTCTVPSTLDPVTIDVDAFRHVMLNLLGNAIRFTPGGGKVSLDARNNAGSVVISVTDTGTGIPEGDIAILFKGTWLGPRPHKMVGSTGMGLYLCKRIIDAHGAQINCSSKEGEGTVFTISIPRAGG